MFAYNLQQAQDIVSLVTNTNDFLHIPSQELHTRDYEKFKETHFEL